MFMGSDRAIQSVSRANYSDAAFTGENGQLGWQRSVTALVAVLAIAAERLQERCKHRTTFRVRIEARILGWKIKLF